MYSEQRATLHSSSAIFKREKNEEVTGSTQGTSIETVQALSYVSLMTLIAMFGLLSFPQNKVGIAKVNITINQLKIDKETSLLRDLKAAIL